MALWMQGPRQSLLLTGAGGRDSKRVRGIWLWSFYVYVWVSWVVSYSLWPYGLQPARLFCPWDFPGKNTGVGSHFFLQKIFLTQGSDLHLLHWQTNSLPLCAWEVWSFCSRGQIWEGNISCAGLFLWPPTTSASSTICSINQAGSVLWL